MAAQFTFDAIGTHWIIDIYEDIDKVKVLRSVMERIELFDVTYSRFRSDSLVTKIANDAGVYLFPDDAAMLFAMYQKVYDMTGGLVTPLIGQVLSDAGYDATYSLIQHKQLQPPPAWDTVMSYHHPYLTVHIPVLLDFGAGGKGYLVDIISSLLLKEGISSFCVDAGGDMVYRTQNGTPLSVGLEHPENASKVVGVVSLYNNALCGSAGNRRVWGEYHHIINPQTLSSPKDILAIWVRAHDALTADILTTALYVTSPDRLKEITFEYLILLPDYSHISTPGFTTELFL